MAMSGADRSKRFRIKNLDALNEKARDRMRAKRAAAKAAGKTAAKPAPKTPSDPARAICEWAKKSLKVPPGHPKEGQRLLIPEYGRLFLQDALADDCHEAALVISRKNAKSAIVAVLLLAYLVGPLRRAGFRAGVSSISREKAGELRGQIEAIATASGLKRIRFWRARTSPAISVHGDGPFIPEILERKGAAGLKVHHLPRAGRLRA